MFQPIMDTLVRFTMTVVVGVAVAVTMGVVVTKYGGQVGESRQQQENEESGHDLCCSIYATKIVVKVQEVKSVRDDVNQEMFCMRAAQRSTKALSSVCAYCLHFAIPIQCTHTLSV